jgi:hypothetical protein
LKVSFYDTGQHHRRAARDRGLRKDALIAPLALLSDVDLASSSQALDAYEDADRAVPNDVFLSSASPEDLDADLSPRTVALSFIQQRLSAGIGHGLVEVRSSGYEGVC